MFIFALGDTKCLLSSDLSDSFLSFPLIFCILPPESTNSIAAQLWPAQIDKPQRRNRPVMSSELVDRRRTCRRMGVVWGCGSRKGIDSMESDSICRRGGAHSVSTPAGQRI
uniref:Uncharacterized protein n=1 Tax=Leersia perrieri TaxID=77586 RepID=A0A0D9XUX4_9ORYZ